MKKTHQHKSQLTRQIEQIDRDLKTWSNRLINAPAIEKSAHKQEIAQLEALKASLSSIVYKKTSNSDISSTTTKRPKIGELPIVPIDKKIEITQSQMDTIVKDSILPLSESFIDDFSRFIGQALTHQKFLGSTAPEALWCCCHDLMTIKEFLRLAILKGEYQREQVA